MSFNSYDQWQSNQPGNPWGQQNQPRPPVVAYRPLNLGDLFDGTFAAIRSNPRVMFAISLVTMGIIGILSGFLAALFPEQEITQITTGSNVDFMFEGADAFAALSNLGAQGILSIVNTAATIVVTGMLVLSVTNAVVGINLDLSNTWNQLKPHFWRLIGTAVLVWLIISAVVVVLIVVPVIVIAFAVAAGSDSGVGVAVLFTVLAIIVAVVLAVWLSVRLYFATMVAVVEGASPTTAISRSWFLTRGSFWRTFGRLILMQVVVGIVVSLLSGAVSVVIMFMTGIVPWAVTAFLLAVTSALVAGLAMPVSASYSALMYVDERIRKENLAPALQAALDEARAR